MSNLFKSKFLLGTLMVAALLVSSTASAAITSTLKMGSNNAQVKELQQGLNGSGFVVSTSGAGSVGSETNYFGSKTKSAVQAWQASKGLTADGIFGAMSRAAWTGGSSMTYPAGCTSTTGFSTTTGMPCNSGSTMTYPAGCTSAVGFSMTTGLPCSSMTSQTGPVTAMLASNNPASGTLVAGQATADLAHFTFNGTGTVTGVTLQRLGVSADTTPSNVYLFDGSMRLSDAASVSSNGSVTFTAPAGLFTVAGSKTIAVKADIASGTSGQTVGMMLATFTTSAGVVTANLSGNIHSIASATLATVAAGTVTPSGATLNPGANVTLWQSTLTVSNRAVWMKRLALRNIGSAPASAFANFKLFVNGVQVGTATGLDANGYVTFDMM
ncbi:MAG: peptidoglycan-binding domain-containing protein, partial [Patescibacteria group bacterium]